MDEKKKPADLDLYSFQKRDIEFFNIHMCTVTEDP